jgi:hypothetical protein
MWCSGAGTRTYRTDRTNTTYSSRPSYWSYTSYSSYRFLSFFVSSTLVNVGAGLAMWRPATLFPAR